MKKSRIATEIVIVYLLLLAMTWVPWVLSAVIPNSFIIQCITFFLIFILVYAACRKNKLTAEKIGYSKEKIGKQLFYGLVVSLITLSIFVLIPLALGVNKYFVLSSGSDNALEIAGNIFIYMALVGPIEEFVFRGYMEERIGALTDKPMLVCAAASLMFGFWHFPTTLNLIHVLLTFIVGLIFSVSKRKLKDCTLISVSLGHGLHDTLIFVLSCIL